VVKKGKVDGLFQHRAQDSIEMHASAIHVREGGVRLVENQRQVCARQNNRLDSVAPDECLGQIREARAFRVSAGPCGSELKLDLMDIVDLIGMGPHNLGAGQRAKHGGLHGEAGSKQSHAAESG
jgi:hypothetical protein